MSLGIKDGNAKDIESIYFSIVGAVKGKSEYIVLFKRYRLRTF